MGAKDVAAPQQVRRAAAQPLADFFRSFDRQFTSAEWAGIRGAGDEAAQEAQFRWVLYACGWQLQVPLLAPCTGHQGSRRAVLFDCSPQYIAGPSFIAPLYSSPFCRRLWSRKEAFVKATGEGLGFPLGDVEFEISGSTGGQAATCALVALVWLRSSCKLVAKERLARPCLQSLCRPAAPAHLTEHICCRHPALLCCPLQPLSA